MIPSEPPDRGAARHPVVAPERVTDGAADGAADGAGEGTWSLGQIQAVIDASPFLSFSRLRVMSANFDAGEITMHCPMREEFAFMAGTGQWHGGPIASMIDTVGDFALGMVVGRGLPTISLNVEYLSPAINTGLTIIARIRRNGRSIGVVDIDVLGDGGRLLAIGRASYATAK